jgi:uncharacterized protein (DUF4415 family)
MKGNITRTTLGTRRNGKTDFQRLRKMPDEEIDYSDVPKLDESFWKTAKLTVPEPKDRVTIRLDHDLVQWLKKSGPGYQTRINSILRSYMNSRSGEEFDLFLAKGRHRLKARGFAGGQKSGERGDKGQN